MTITRSASVSVARRLGIELARSIKSRLAIDPKCFDESNDFYGDPGDAPEWSMSDAPDFPAVLYQTPWDCDRFTEAQVSNPLSTWKCDDCEIGVYVMGGNPMTCEAHLFELDPLTGFWSMSDEEVPEYAV